MKQSDKLLPALMPINKQIKWGNYSFKAIVTPFSNY